MKKKKPVPKRRARQPRDQRPAAVIQALEIAEQDAVERGLAELPDKLLAILRRKKRQTTRELAEGLLLDEHTVTEALEAMQGRGVLVYRFGDAWGLEKAPSTQGDVPEYHSRPDGTFLFGFSSDQHLCSKHERLDVLHDLYQKFATAGVDRVFNSGNWIDGEARFNMHELKVHGMDEQCRYLTENFPRFAGITTYAIAGDDHEGWYCFEPGVEILTKERGWVNIATTLEGESVATKTASGQFAWQVPTKVIRKYHNGKLVRIRHRSVDVAVTMDHRFEVYRKPSNHGRPISVVMTAWEILESFKSRCIGIPRTTESWTGTPIDHIEIPVRACRYLHHSKIWHPQSVSAHTLAVLCAWFATEGCVDGNLVRIAQSKKANPENHRLIAECIRELGGWPLLYDDSICVSSKDLAFWLDENCGRGWAEKRLPQWAMDMPQDTLRAVFDALVRGDGHNRGDGCGWKFYSGSQALLAQMAEMCQKLQLTSSSRPGNGCIDLHVGERHRVAWLFEKPTLEDYAGEVFCVCVPSERIYVRKNGKTLWSMNSQREGIDIGKHAERGMREAGRDDWHNLGYMEAFVRLVNAGSGEWSTMLLIHPGGGSAYAHSYKPQKIVESFSGGSKPAVLLIGHYHKLSYNLVRNVHALQCGTCQDQTCFQRKKSIDAHVGGGICKLTQDPETGAIVACQVEFYCYYDRGYYNHRWSHGGKVILADRGV